MPTLPAINTGSGTTAYAPLEDAYSPQPVLSRMMPPSAAMSRNSTSSSFSSDSSATNGYASTERHVYTQQPTGSDETLSAITPTGPTGKGKGRMPDVIVPEDEGDVGDYKEKERERERKGKMRADGRGSRVWDEEQGRVEVYGGGSYPPTNEEEDEERKIQEVCIAFALPLMAFDTQSNIIG